MKNLYLIRHAKSSWDDPGLDDIDRPLNKRGKRDAPQMGARLRDSGVRPGMICTSPAKRARKTARYLADALDYASERIVQQSALYTSSMERLLFLVRETSQDVDTLFLVGHNPVLGEFADFFLGTSLGHLPTCGIIGIAFAVSDWREVAADGGTLLVFDYPKKDSSAKSL